MLVDVSLDAEFFSLYADFLFLEIGWDVLIPFRVNVLEGMC